MTFDRAAALELYECERDFVREAAKAAPWSGPPKRTLVTDFAAQGTVQVPASEIQLPSGFIVDDVERKNKESTFVDHLAFDESLERFWMDRQDRFQVVQHRQGAVHYPVHMAFAIGTLAFLAGKDFDSTRDRLQVESEFYGRSRCRSASESEKPRGADHRRTQWSSTSPLQAMQSRERKLFSPPADPFSKLHRMTTPACPVVVMIRPSRRNKRRSFESSSSRQKSTSR